MAHERRGRDQGCPHLPGARQLRLVSRPPLAPAGYWHGGRLASLEVLGLSGSSRASRQQSALQALDLVKWHERWVWMLRQDEMEVLALPEMNLRHL